MTELTLAHTSMVDPATLGEVRAMVEEAFDGRFGDHDWDHTLGGVHCIAWEDGAPAGHAAVVSRRMVHAGRALRTGYVEGMAVRADHRRRGLGSALMEAAEGVIAAAFEIGGLAATEAGRPLYVARGWAAWEGRLSALTPDGRRATPEARGGVYVHDPSALLDLAGELTCDWRDGDVW